MMDGGGMFFGGGFMWIFWIAIIIAVIWLVKSVMNSNSGNSNSSSNETPMEILKKRYASGEVDEEEFNRRRKELEK